ncbi:MAG: hypothetical protein WCV80_03255 [Candidatus Paceibacterota bacterium]|jgi:hypothetical protein
MGYTHHKRFILEVILDESFFEKKGKKNVFRYREKSAFLPIRAKNARNAKKLIPKKIEEFKTKESITSLSVVDFRFYAQGFLNHNISWGSKKKRKYEPSH